MLNQAILYSGVVCAAALTAHTRDIAATAAYGRRRIRTPEGRYRVVAVQLRWRTSRLTSAALRSPTTNQRDTDRGAIDRSRIVSPSAAAVTLRNSFTTASANPTVAVIPSQ